MRFVARLRPSNRASSLSNAGRIAWRRSTFSIIFIVLLATLSSTLVLALIVGWDAPALRLDLIKVGLTVGAGSGAVLTLLYGIRRQILAEEVASDNRHDAAEKRTTELYVKGVEQLASQQLTARFGGLYALERLASDEPRLRPVVVNVVCAVLRQSPTEEDDAFRQGAEALLRDHLGYEPRFHIFGSYWDNVPMVVLGGATLGSGLTRAWKVDTVHMPGAKFPRGAHFEDARIRGANFRRITVSGDAQFDEAKLDKGIFAGATFSGLASFRGVEFSLEVNFQETVFESDLDFEGAVVGPHAYSIILPPGWQLGEPREDGWRPIIPLTEQAPARHGQALIEAAQPDPSSAMDPTP